MDDVTALIRALATLAWPIIVGAALWYFRAEIRTRIRSLRRGRFLGQEFEFGRELDELNREATAAVEISQPDEAGASAARERAESILRDAVASPKATLMLLSAEIEQQVREIFMASQEIRDIDRRGLAQNLRALPLAEHALRAIEVFRDVRNRIVHGHAATEDEALRAIDSGLALLEALRNIPRTGLTVYAPNAELYADADGQERRTDAHGVMLERREPDEALAYSVHPTTRAYRRGDVVAWEWSFERTWDKTWFRHPDTGELEHAWDSSAEFVGRVVRRADDSSGA